MDQHPTITDAAIALVLAALALLQLRTYWEIRQPIHPGFAVALTLGVILPLTWRRRFPVIVLLAMAGLLLLHRYLDIPEGNFTGNSVALALLSAAAYGGRWRGWACVLVIGVVLGSTTYELIIADLSEFEGNQILLRTFSLAWTFVILGATWWFGDVIRTRRLRQFDLEDRTRQLERERGENARRAVLDERVRIARELHDVVAHHVSVMGVQAGAARRVLDRSPDKAREALSTVELSSRQAVNELHRLLGFLRREGESEDLSPQPSMNHLDVLVDQMRDAGMTVEMKIVGDQRPLPSSVDLSSYRIIQEALTNTLKHAGPAQTKVTVTYREDSILLEIVDNGLGAAKGREKAKGGTGIMGMRERVGLHGGALEVGPLPEGGFAVRATLPLRGGIR